MQRFILTGLFILCTMLIVGCNDSNEDAQKKGDSATKAISGTWTGAIEVPNSTLDIQVTFQQEDKLKSMLTIPAQGVTNYPFSTVDVEETTVYLDTNIGGQEISFNGERKEEKIEGTFTQAGQSFSFHLAKGSKAEAKEEGDFLQVETSEGTLYGEVEMPGEKGKYPVLLIIPGSGPTTRDGNTDGAGKNNSLKMLAEELANKGIASVRIDKRGVGKNASATIPDSEIRFDRFVKDAEKWIESLNEDERFSHVGVIGHSQGSLVGMMAAQNQNVDAFVSLAGAGRSFDKVVEGQLKTSLPKDHFSKAQTILDKLAQGETVEEVPAQLQSLFRPTIQPFMISWIQHQPTEEIKQVDAPTLIVNGTTDIQVPVEEAKALHQAKQGSQLLVIDGMNHVLKEASENREENIKTYTNPDLPLARGLVEGMMKFFKEVEFKK